MDPALWVAALAVPAIVALEIARRRADRTRARPTRPAIDPLPSPPRPGSRPPSREDERLFGQDAHGLAEEFDAIAAEAGRTRGQLLGIRLAGLRTNRVPLRTIRASPAKGVARLGFADGTVILARSVRQGDLSAVAIMRQQAAVLVADFDEHPDGMTLHLAAEGRRCTLIAVGLDQGD